MKSPDQFHKIETSEGQEKPPESPSVKDASPMMK